MDLEQILAEDDETDSYISEQWKPSESHIKETAVTNHTSEEWALLQSILGEKDDHGDDFQPNSFTNSSSQSTDSPNNWEDAHFLETILKADNDAVFSDNDDDDSLQLPPPPPTFTAMEAPKTEWKTADVIVIPSSTSFGEESVKNTKEPTIPTRKAMNRAKYLEGRLLEAGKRVDITSPLMVKRRLRPKVTLTAQPQKCEKWDFSGMVQQRGMEKIKAQLEKHASKEEAKVFCGLPTCMSCNSKFIAIGTQQGIVLVFDMFQTLRQRLGASSPNDTANDAVKDKPTVTSVDVSPNGELLIAGYANGMVLLWDLIKGCILKNIAEDSSPISWVRFLNEAKIITANVGGGVYRLTLHRNMLWNSYSVETDCLLDGTAGQVLAIQLLPSASETIWTALSSERGSFVVAVEPQVNVLYRWSKPSEEDGREDTTDDGSKHVDIPCLAWTWTDNPHGGRPKKTKKRTPLLARGWGLHLQFLQITNWQDEGRKFEEVQSVQALGSIVALEWLNGDSAIMYLTRRQEFHLVDRQTMTLLERLDFANRYALVYAELALSRTEEEASVVSFQNSLRYDDDRLLLLCRNELVSLSILGAQARVKALEEDGEWLEALALALDYYDESQDEWIAKLLLRYIHLAVENAPSLDLVHSHYQMLAGVCVEFCVVTQRLDLLYGPIWETFTTYRDVFFKIIEPYILTDQLSYLAPPVMAAFLTNCQATQDVATVERCLLHLDCTMMDFDSILTLLKTNEMYTALFFVYTQGLDDFVTPLRIVLESVLDQADVVVMPLRRRQNGLFTTDLERFGYKALFYLQMSFEGHSFPLGKPLKRSVTMELLGWLLQRHYQHPTRRNEDSIVVGTRAQVYPYLSVLIQLDAQAVFETLDLAFINNELTAWNNDEAATHASATPDISMQQVIDALVCILLRGNDTMLHSRQGEELFFDFCAQNLIRGIVKLEPDIVFRALTRTAQVYSHASNEKDKRKGQQDVLDLLGALPSESYTPNDVLNLIKEYNIHRAALLLHQQVASVWNTNAEDSLRRHHYKAAIDCFLEDSDEEFRLQVFPYVLKDGPSAALREKLPDLVCLHPQKTARLVAELFGEEFSDIIGSVLDGKTQFLLLQAIMEEGVLPVSIEHYQLYLELMVEYHPSQVYTYLSTHDNYRAADALKLCQKKDIADASAYLLEKMGNVSSALQILLQTLESRLMTLKRTIRSNKSEDATNSVEAILVVALDVCARNTETSTKNEYGSGLWFNVLDRLIHAKQFLRLHKEQPQHRKKMASVLSDLLRLVMQRMVSSVPLMDLVRKVTADYSGSQLGEIREMLHTLLNTYGLDLKVLQVAHTTMQNDVGSLQKGVWQVKQLGIRVDTIENGATRDGMLQVSAQDTPTITSSSIMATGPAAANQLHQAFSRLEQRRQQRSSRKISIHSYRPQEMEPHMLMNPSDLVVGQLGEPGSVGRIVS